LSAVSEPVGLLVVGDGATALSPKAPGGGERASAVRLQKRIDTALECGDLETLADLDAQECDAEGVGGRVAWQVAAAVARASRAHTDVDPARLDPECLYAAAPFGVGYVVARWTPLPAGPRTGADHDRR
ncbi:hypothetical protein B1964_08860, partial [Gordonia sp. i37]